MTNEQTRSWIFLSIAMASQNGPTDFEGISSIADGINHAIPTHKEMQSSISWLTDKELISKQGKKYLLATKGKYEYELASKDSNLVYQIWQRLENNLPKI